MGNNPVNGVDPSGGFLFGMDNLLSQTAFMTVAGFCAGAAYGLLFDQDHAGRDMLIGAGAGLLGSLAENIDWSPGSTAAKSLIPVLSVGVDLAESIAHPSNTTTIATKGDSYGNGGNSVNQGPGPQTLQTLRKLYQLYKAYEAIKAFDKSQIHINEIIQSFNPFQGDLLSLPDSKNAANELGFSQFLSNSLRIGLNERVLELVHLGNRLQANESKYSNEPPVKATRLKNGQGWRDKDGNLWKKDKLHRSLGRYR